MRRLVIFSVLSASVVIVILWGVFAGPKVEDTQVAGAADEAIVTVTMPELSGDAQLGAQAFEGLCADCHRADAGGIEGKGPPLIHKIYEPGHHGDFAFVRAVRLGVRSHHWRFGDMPPVEGATDADIKAIIAFIRTVQGANGIN